MLDIRQVTIERYIMPFKEGGSLPALVDADDGFSYVLKLRGAGQGTRALIADFIGGMIAKVLGLKVPEMVFAHVGHSFGQSEPDEEIQELLKKSVGINLGVSYLSKSVTFDPVATFIPPALADKILWLDAFLMNVDRTVKNTNMLVWHNELWLIDHGASLYFHHNIENWQDMVASPFSNINTHVLRYNGQNIYDTDTQAKALLTTRVIDNIIDSIPEDWLTAATSDISVTEQRLIYNLFLQQRLLHSDNFIANIAKYEQ
jgi:hypothetical protein